MRDLYSVPRMNRIGTRQRLPARYQEEWGKDFWDRINAALHPGTAVLDVGAGRRPTISIEERPSDIEYVGLDVSLPELEAAPPGSYDEIVAIDVHELAPALVGRFELIVMWQVLEHFRDLRLAASIIRQYAKPGGLLVAHLSGRNAVYSIANRILPDRVANRTASLLMRRPLETVFPAHYDHCDAKGLAEVFAQWRSVEVIPFWRGADYFQRLGPLRGLYVRYEDWTVARAMDNLATHYTLAARN